ncbi:MAG: hypothetical protein LBO82_10780 [Synergistaceae bacterium]|nr:hypothetical protein [Synergistaceae bacterium]
MPENRLLPLFGITQWLPHEVHALKDKIFLSVVTELVRNGWNCNYVSFGESRRETFLMEMSACGFSGTVARLLEMGAEANYNCQGYGASTPLMCAQDPAIMKKLLYYEANPLAVNAMNQTDFTYKLLKGLVPGALFYFYNSEKIPFQSLLNNFQDCILSGGNVPYEPMYPLCLVPVVPGDVPYTNIIDRPLIDSMLKEQFLPFSSASLNFRLEGSYRVWQYIKARMAAAKTVVPALAIAFMACMTKLEECRKTDDFAFFEAYIDKDLPREIVPRSNLSKPVFVYMLFALANLPSVQLLRWLALIGKFTRKLALWMDILGELPFKVVNPLSDRHGSHVLQELVSMQTLLTMRVNVTTEFGEFNIPESLTPAP